MKTCLAALFSGLVTGAAIHVMPLQASLDRLSETRIHLEKSRTALQQAHATARDRHLQLLVMRLGRNNETRRTPAGYEIHSGQIHSLRKLDRTGREPALLLVLKQDGRSLIAGTADPVIASILSHLRPGDGLRVSGPRLRAPHAGTGHPGILQIETFVHSPAQDRILFADAHSP